ncbi:Truncated GTP-binding protein [Klebsiella michiganensis]|uniref:Truncated GTP-binding protein n=1 Tax=Salmonella typhimurium TaxID=90371 RepID=O84887_SALTM|nr:truncated GTP-binding protein [Salmonella enterica subsp. enterica serovar Typhimurium]
MKNIRNFSIIAHIDN